MPATISTSAYCCINLQQALMDVAGSNAPASIGSQTGFLDSLVSPYNTEGFERVQTDAFPGKGRPDGTNPPKIEIAYLKPDLATPVTTAPDMCADQTDDTDPYGYLDVSVAKVLSVGGEFTKGDFDALCESPQERLAFRVRRAAEAIKREMDKILIQDATAVLGNYADGTPSTGAAGANARDLPVLSTNGSVNPGAMASVATEMDRMLDGRPPIVVGGYILSTWARIAAAVQNNAGSTLVSGADAAFGIQAFIDQYIDAEIDAIETTSGLSHAIAYAPGSFQLLEWFRNTGYYEELNRDGFTETTIEIDGIRYDYTLYYDECAHQWKWTLAKWFDLFAIPCAAYQPTYDWCRRFHFTMGCGDFACTNFWL